MPAPLDYSTSKSPEHDPSNALHSFGTELPQLDDEVLPVSIDLSHADDLEASFCQNFQCCGLSLDNLHDLLQHFEEYHIRLEEGPSSASEYEVTSTPPPNSSHIPCSPSRYSVQSGISYSSSNNDIKMDHRSELDYYNTYPLNNSDSKNQFNQDVAYFKRESPTRPRSTTPTCSTSLSCTDWISSEKQNLYQSFKKQKSSSSVEKPYKCLVSGCNKTYKNPNGLKYHAQHGHCANRSKNKDTSTAKQYQCAYLDCKKSYKNLNGLKYHIEHSHSVAIPSRSLTQ